MGFFRKVYIEIRDLFGLGLPEENDEQRAERIAGELKEVVDGSVKKFSDNFIVTGEYQDRETKLQLEPGPNWCIIEMQVGLKISGLSFTVEHERKEPSGELEEVGSHVYLSGYDAAELAEQKRYWSKLSLGARSALLPLVQNTEATVTYEDGTLTYRPYLSVLEERDPKSMIRSQLGVLHKFAEALEVDWR